MQSFFVIGTAHMEDPSLCAALEHALDEAEPSQLILEMPDELVASGEVATQKPEMLVAYRWAQERQIPVRGHEPPGPPILRDGLSPQRMGELLQDMETLMSGLSVRETIDIFCDRRPPNTPVETRLSQVIAELIDPQKAAARSRAIAEAVRRLAVDSGRILVVCGGNHVSQIMASLPDCRVIRGEHFF